jgi:hypothetical protein
MPTEVEIPAPLSTMIFRDSLRSTTASSMVLKPASFRRRSSLTGAGDTDGLLRARYGETEAFLFILSKYGVLRTLDGDRDTLRPGVKGGLSQLILDVGVLGVCSRELPSVRAE